MTKPCYLKIDDIKDYDKIKGFCDDNNINVQMTTQLYGYAAESCIDIIAREDNIELKSLFVQCEDSDYEYDTVCEEVEESIMKILDDNFDEIKDTFYKRLEVRGIYKRGE